MLDKNFSINRGQQYYFQFIPTHIIIKNASIAKKISSQSKFKIKLFKGIQKTSQTNFISANNIINTVIPIENTSMSFSLPNYSIDKNIEFTLKLIKDQQEVGQVKMDVRDYVTNFKNNQECTQQQFKLFANLKESQFSIKLQIFVNKSRFNLQKTIRSKKTQSLANSRQDSIRSNNQEKFNDRNKQRKIMNQSPDIRRSNVVMRSENQSQSSGRKSYASYTKNQQQRFMTHKKYARKPSGDRKLLLKSDRTNSQKSNTERNEIQSIENSRAKQSRVLSKRLSPKNSGRPSPSKQIDFENFQGNGNQNLNNSPSKKFAIEKSANVEAINQPKAQHTSPAFSGKYKIQSKRQQNRQIAKKHSPKIDSKVILQNKPEPQKKQKKLQSSKNPLNVGKSKDNVQNAQKKISFVQRTNSILINNDEQMEQHKIKLAQSIKYNNKINTQASLNNSSKLKEIDEISMKGSQRSVKVKTSNRPRRNSEIHTMNQSRNSKLEKSSQKKPNQTNKDKVNNQTKNKIILLAFMIISLFLVYQAMSPSKKYNSRKIKGNY